MSKVVKFYYSIPVAKAIIAKNPLLNKTVISKLQYGKRHTIAAVFNDEDQTIKFGLATCLPVDNFCKAVGRKIAEKNAVERPFHIIENFTGRRNDYADEVIDIMTKMDFKLMKRENPNIFNPDNFI